VFQLTFDDGATTRCSEDHLWRVQDRGARFRKESARFGTWAIKSLAEIRASGGDTPRPVQRHAVQTAVAQTGGYSRPLPLDPYLLGVLIGDDGLTSGVRLTTADPEIVGYVAAALPDGLAVRHIAGYDYGITGGNRGGESNPVLDALRDLGLHGKRSEDKFIPPAYLFADPASRLALLQGLMDTDGHVQVSGHMEFSTSAPLLARDFADLVRLLGGKAKVVKRETTHLDSYRIHVRLPGLDCFRLPRKADRRKDPVSTTDLRVLHTIEPMDTAECVCIRVAHPQHTYITKDGIVTHNSGKTTAGIVDDIIQGIDAEMVPDHLKQFKRFRPPFRCRIAAQGREEIEDFIFEKMREWMPPSQLLGGQWKTAYDKVHHVLHLKNGTTYSFKTFQQEAQQWGGSTLDRVHMDEEPGNVHLQEARLRVMRRKGDLLFTMTPVNGLTHMFDEFEAAMEAAQTHGGIIEDDGLGLVIVDMDDNPWLTPEDIEEALRGLSYEERLARKEGKFVALSGLIYPDFKRELHVVPALEKLPGNVNVVVSIDPGIRYACAVGWHYLDANDNMVMFEELYEKDQTIGQVCEQIHRINAHYNCQPIYYVIDPAARNRNSQTGRSDQMEFADHGVVTIPGQNSVTAGINRCRERLQSRRFVVTENCTNFLKEIRTYRWKKPPRGEGDGKPVPVKQDDHMMDAFRLCVMSRPWRPEEVIPDNESQMEKLVREHYDAVNRPVESAV
jgi:phage terminase large subunit-like protein